MKLLIISNQCLDNSTSNGRTLLNFLGDFLDKNEVLNLYITGQEYQDKNVDYLRIPDMYVLKSLLSLGIYKYRDFSCGTSTNKANAKKRKTPTKVLIRDSAWSSLLWYKKNIKKRITTFAPDAVLLFGADLPFFYKFSKKLSKDFNCPLYIFTTEDYPLKKYNYISKRKDAFYPLFRKRLYKWAKKAYACSKYCFFNTPSLMDAYVSNYSLKKDNCYVMFPKSSISNISFSNNKNKLLYAGNLGVGRLDSLIELADVLKQVNNGAIIDVYSKVTDEQKEKIANSKNIRYLGFIDYSNLIEEYPKYGILLHAEGFGEYNELDLKYAFTSKLPDLIESGALFVFYAHKNLSETIFLQNIECNTIASNKDELRHLLSDIYNDKINTTKINYEKYEEIKKSKTFSDIICGVNYVR